MAYVFGNIQTVSGSTREPVVAATTAPGTLATDFENGDVLDGITLATNNRILIKDQASPIENGIYEVQATGAPIRASDFYDGSFAGGITVTVTEGTINEDTLWLCTSDPPNDIIGTNALTFLRSAGEGANGDMSGPASSTTSAIPRFADTGGKALTTTNLIVDGSDNLSGVASLALNAGANTVTLSATAQTTGSSVVNIPNLNGTGGDAVISNATQTLTNKTLTAPNISTIVNTGTLTLPTTTDTLIGRATADTLTNKTLTAPNISTIVNTGTLTLPTSTDTIVARATADTLTNKTMTAGNNTFSGFRHGIEVDQPSSGVHGVTGNIVGTSDVQTLTNKTITSPRVGTAILDTAGNELLIVTATASAVNELTLANASTGTDPVLSATGGDTDIGIALETKGAGSVSVGSVSGTNSGILEIMDNTGVESVSLTVPAALGGTYVFTLPNGVGSSGQFLRTDGANPATLSWASPAANQDLASVLTTGNTTGGNDIVMSGATDTLNFTRTNNLILDAATIATTDRTVTLPDPGANDTVTYLALAQTLTNKIISSSTNTVGANELRTTGASVVIDTAAPPSVGQILKATNSTTATWQNETGGGSADYKDHVIAATTGPGTLSTDFENGDTLDGVILSTNDRILIKNQSTGSENGIYVVQATGSPIRSADMANGTSAGGSIVFVIEGSANGDQGFICTNDTGSDIVGTDALLFEQFTSAGSVSGPGAATDNAIVRWDGTAGTAIQNSVTIINDAGAISGLTSVGMSGDILDANGNELINFTTTASAVNEIAITNAATGTNPLLGATGGDTNISMAFQAKGTGTYRFLGTTTAPAEIRLYENTGNGTDYTAWTAPASTTTTTTLRMPDGVGTSGQFLRTDGANPATLTWASPSASITTLLATSTTPTSTTSGTYVLLNAMSFTTPAAGTWVIIFSSSGTVSQANTTTEYMISINGGTSAVTGSTRDLSLTANNITGTTSALHSSIRVTLTGAENVGVYYRTSGGSFSVNTRSLTAIKVA